VQFVSDKSKPMGTVASKLYGAPGDVRTFVRMKMLGRPEQAVAESFDIPAYRISGLEGR
jgi:hypothetical protein